MTEAGWLVCDDPRVMLKSLRGRATDRQLRLFVVASCRRLIPFVENEKLREAVNTVERYADGQATYGEMGDAAKASERIGWFLGGRDKALADAAWVATAMGLWYWLRPSHGLSVSSVICLLMTWSKHPTKRPSYVRSSAALANRFLLTPMAHPEVVTLARSIYDEQRFRGMGKLAEMLEEAGCRDPAILAHCRQSGEHVRGCWVLDLLRPA